MNLKISLLAIIASSTALANPLNAPAVIYNTRDGDTQRYEAPQAEGEPSIQTPAQNNQASGAPGSGRISSGTGFFVSNRGHLITNEHVVSGCSKVMVRGAVAPTVAEVIATDKANDLALLKANVTPPRIANIRPNQERVQPGDKVVLIGYPMEHGITGQYAVSTAQVINLRGPMDEPKWIQFTDSAQQGNSGGPLLDDGGNVIGVVVGKATLMATSSGSGSEGRVIRKSDVAISLPVLHQFLDNNGIYYRKSTNDYYVSDKGLERRATNYIVNVHCVR